MDFVFDIYDLLSENEIERLKAVLGIQAPDEFRGLMIAAFMEYKDMLLGQGMTTRADDLKQFRLFLLIKHYFIDRIPNESEISAMFQLTESESRSLIKNVRTRYRYKLEEEQQNTLTKIIKEFKYNDQTERFETVIQSDNALEELNRVISIKNPTLEPIRKIKGASKLYSVSEDSLDALKDFFLAICEVS